MESLKWEHMRLYNKALEVDKTYKKYGITPFINYETMSDTEYKEKE